MRIAIENILPDPSRPVYDKAHRAWARRRRQRRMPVVLAEQGKFYLLCGHNTIDAAQRAGEDLVECVVRQGVSDEEREEFRLTDEYFSSLLPPIKMAESFIRYREKYHTTGTGPTNRHHGRHRSPLREPQKDAVTKIAEPRRQGGVDIQRGSLHRRRGRTSTTRRVGPTVHRLTP